MTRYSLVLFITGNTAKSSRAIATLRSIFGSELDDQDITIVDVLERPDLAEAERILATPTLIRQAPPPARRIIGDLSDRNTLLRSLDLEAESA